MKKFLKLMKKGIKWYLIQYSKLYPSGIIPY